MKPMHTVYCVRPMTGFLLIDIKKYYKYISKKLRGIGYKVYYPLVCEEEMNSTQHIPAQTKSLVPGRTSRAIFSRDKWMVQSADIIYANLLGSTKASIGSCFELAWGHILGKHTVIVMEENNPHRHTFVIESADIIFTDEKNALKYLKDWGAQCR